MKNYDLITPEGTKDLLFDECIFRRDIENKLNNIFKDRAYSEVITPAFEFFDVFNLNSRYFPQESLYKFVDSKGRLLVLRPDSTTPIARMVATRLKDAQLPLRLYYNQSVFASNPLLTGRSDQVKQTGIELIGSASIMADLEVISTAIDVLSSCSSNYSLELGDVGYFRELVNKLDISDEQKENIRDLIEVKNYPALNDLLDTIGDSDVIKALKQLPRLFGGEEVFEKAAKLFSDEKIDEILAKLKGIYMDIKNFRSDGRITIDLGMVNKTDYYTGVIIQGYVDGVGEAIISGGRYDKLISDFGYDVPATGFAVNVDALTKLAVKSNTNAKTKPSDVLIFAEKGYEMKAILHAQKLRSEEGLSVEISLAESIDEANAYANGKGIAKLIKIDN